MFENPLVSVLYFIAAAYIFKIWYADLRAVEKPKNAFPGAEYASLKSVTVAVVGILVLLAAYTYAEILAGVEGEQKSLEIWMLFSMIAAAFVEELIFRGFLVVENKGRAFLILSIVGFSVIFSIFHMFFVSYTEESGVVFSFTIKAGIDMLFIFINSLWFYAVRFMPINPKHSLIPCFAAHLANNLGVYAIKIFQGFA